MSPLVSNCADNPPDNSYLERCATEDTPAFAASPPSVSPQAVTTSSIPTGLSPSSTRKCEGCKAPHPGTYGSGRFCSATCAKKVGAKQKWAARAPTATGVTRRATTARHPTPDAPCESCSKLHNKSYGSGRFCSVHCARRVAATRKWEKSRSEKSKRLEAIRPAMLALPPHANSSHAHIHGQIPLIAGKRRRVIGRHLEQLHISDANPSSFYLNQQTYPIQQRLDVQSTSRPHTPCTFVRHPQTHLISSAPDIPNGYLQAHPHPSTIHYTHPSHIQPNANISFVSQQILYPSQAQSLATHLHGHNYYAYSTTQPYAIAHQNPSQMDTSTYSTASPSTSPDPDMNGVRQPPVSFPTASHPLQESSPSTQLKQDPTYETDTITTSASPAPSTQADVTPSSCARACMSKTPARMAHADIGMEKTGPDTSESAAQALLCLRATNS